MAQLSKSTQDRLPYQGHELLACGICFGEQFRGEGDPFRETFRLYRDVHGMIWRTVKPIADLGPTTEPLVCLTCEEAGHERSHPSKADEPLVVYDHKTGEQIPPTPPTTEGRWT